MPNEQKKIPLKPVAIEVKDDLSIKRVYANYVSVTTGPHDCSLNFCLVERPLDPPSKPEAKVVAKIMIPNSLVKDVIRVITLNFDNAMKRMERSETKK